jgi:N-acetyl-beta-hexosaminidase
VEYSVYPRLSALAEVAWTRLENRNYKDFRQRQKFYKLYLKSKGINYYLLDGKTRRKLVAVFSHGKDGREFKKNEKFKQTKKK